MNITDISIDYSGGTIALPARAAELDGDRLRVLVRLAHDSRLCDAYSDAADDAARELGMDRATLDRLVTDLAERGFLACSVKYGGGTAAVRGAAQKADTPSGGLQKAETSPKKYELPNYTGQELAELLERDGGKYGYLVDECQRTLGRVFTGTETSKIVALCDTMGLEPEFVLLVCAYCAGKGKNSVRYAERTACLLVEEGVDDAVKLGEYIKRKERYNSIEYRLREMLGFGGRAPTKKESQYFQRWIDEWGFGLEIMSRAYEITVKYTDRAALPYMDKILAGWHEKGYTTPEQIDAEEERRRAEKAAEPGTSSFDTDEFFELALKRSYELMGENASKSGGDTGSAGK
jgi:DnaD/phage-associated family protein